MTRTDHFSGVAKAYAAYRPKYPVELFDYVATLTTHHRRVWDCGAGSGQAAEGLLPQFSSVVATDISRSQLSSATAASKLLRVAASAERSPLASGSVDAVVVAQALHWIELPMFYAEVQRIVAHGGVIVVWSYDLAVLGDPELDAVLHHFYNEKLDRYWPPERRLVEARYRGILFPFEELTVPQFSMVADWTLDDLLGYVGTWSALSRYKASHEDDPTPLLAGQLERRWGRQETRRIRWPLAVRAGRV